MLARLRRLSAVLTACILLTDLAHDLFADFHSQALVDSPFADYSPKRIVRDLLFTPGRLVFHQERLVRVELLSQKQFSSDLAICLNRFYSSLKPE